MTRTAILSDIHGNLTALKTVLDHVATQNVDRIVCLGDVVGYGPEPCQCLDIVMGFGFCVLGNHDSSALFDPEGFNVTAEQAIFWTRNQLESGRDGPEQSRKRMEFLCELPRTVRESNVLFVHGSPRGPTNEYVMPEDIQNIKKMEKLFSMVPHLCFQGHTHVPGIFTTDHQFIRHTEIVGSYSVTNANKRLMINVGSVGQPRDGDSRSCYVVFDGDSVAYHRVEYDIEDTVRKIEAEPELDNFLGYRLREGR
ncbi:metallophosphoesterase family protein [Stieleria varia]|uniref:Phosphodiesterase n=1 Tax=Stieleria varia TaxID=2528005 RepID=A0A5C6AWH2_9BACT|nr:metallophosphoesterase family protein [Stieleria varia]TWU02474.1 phosphodiesterase [Stieleria varia]